MQLPDLAAFPALSEWNNIFVGSTYIWNDMDLLERPRVIVLIRKSFRSPKAGT